MKILLIYIFIGLIASLVMFIADRKGVIGEENQLVLLDHILLILLWPVVLITTIVNLIMYGYDTDDNDAADEDEPDEN